MQAASAPPWMKLASSEPFATGVVSKRSTAAPSS
jgi:hypothetical protein